MKRRMKQGESSLYVMDVLQSGNDLIRNITEMVHFYEDQISQLNSEIVSLMCEIEGLKDKYERHEN